MKRLTYTAVCGCGVENYSKNDWISHWKHGKSKWRAIKLFLLTRININWRNS